MKRFGNPVPNIAPKEIYEDAPGLGWEVSEETMREIAEIDENTRMAVHRASLLHFARVLDGGTG